jgi:iron(III) transport system ATP-binding protein
MEIRDLVVRYGDVVAVDHASLDVVPCSITALVGPSGCGKTSVLRAIAGFERPDEGTITIAGTTVTGSRSWIPPERRSVGMVFQEGALFPNMTVSANVRYGIDTLPDAAARAASVLDRVGLSAVGNRYPDELSGGQQQRVAVARALAPAPAVVLLDEPFASLDAALRARVRDEVCSILRGAEATALIVTHDQEEALSLADRVAVMMEGRILQSGTPEEIYDRPVSSAVCEFVGGGQLLPCTIRAGRLQSALGAAECDADEGAGLLLVRPENVALLATHGSAGVSGRITERHFYGHDRVYDVQLDSGPLIRVRSRGPNGAGAGGAIRVGLHVGRYLVFGADAGAGPIGYATSPEA